MEEWEATECMAFKTNVSKYGSHQSSGNEEWRATWKEKVRKTVGGGVAGNR